MSMPRVAATLSLIAPDGHHLVDERRLAGEVLAEAAGIARLQFQLERLVAPAQERVLAS
ncbi:TPA: hypothetical protein ACSPKT_001160 [Pseudomonas aeruginosa]